MTSSFALPCRVWLAAFVLAASTLMFCPFSLFADDPGLALQFDGASDFVRLSPTIDMMGAGWESAKTVTLWVNPTGTATCTSTTPVSCDAIFGDKPRLWGMSRGSINGQDRIWVFNWDRTLDRIGVPYTAGEWIHIAMVHGGGRLTAYKNGLVVGDIASGATSYAAGTPLVLQMGGIINNSTQNWTFEGQIDEVQIWNRALSAEEVSKGMNQVLAGDEAGLAAYYQMSDGSGAMLTDDSVYSWEGTLWDGCCGVPADGPILWVPSGAFGVEESQALDDQSSALMLAGDEESYPASEE